MNGKNDERETQMNELYKHIKNKKIRMNIKSRLTEDIWTRMYGWKNTVKANIWTKIKTAGRNKTDEWQ